MYSVSLATRNSTRATGETTNQGLGRRGPEEEGRERENTTDNEIPVGLRITHTDQRASRGRAGALARRLQSAGIAARQRDNDEGRPSRGERASAFHCVSYMLSNDRERNYSFGGGGGGMASCLHTYYAYVARTDYILVCTYSHAGPT